MANAFVHVVLNTTDLDKAKSFYGSLFDWKLEDMPMPMGTYTMIDVGGEDETGGGMLKHPVPGAPSMWLPYVVVDDVGAANAKVTSLGGKVMQDKTEIPNMGWFSIIEDPTGAVLGLWQTSRKE